MSSGTSPSAALSSQSVAATNSSASRSEPESLLSAPPFRAVIRLATPTTLVMVVAATSNVLYTYYVSRLGADSIAAVSLVFPVSLIAITAMGGGIGAGASSAVARALGANRRDEATTVAEHAFVLSVFLGIVFALIIQIGAGSLFSLMGGQGVVLDHASLFARVLFGGAAISFTAAMFDSVMRGEGNVRVPAIWSSTSLLMQIGCTPLFMFVFKWGLLGAPLAALTCQFIALLPRARYLFGGLGIVQPKLLPRTWKWNAIGEVLRVGVPASLSTIINYTGLMVLTGVVARIGKPHLAAYGLGTRLDFLLLSFAYGFGAAVLTLVGMATGAHRPEKTRIYVLRAGAMIVLLQGALGLLLFHRPEIWFNLFTHDPDLLEVGARYFHWIGPSYPFVGVAMVLSFAFQGLGRATIPLAWMSLRVVAVVSVSLLCTQYFGLDDSAVFATVAIGNMLSAVIMSFLFWRVERKLYDR